MTNTKIFNIENSLKSKTKISLLIEEYNNATDCFTKIKILDEISQITDFYYDFSLEDFKSILLKMLKDIENSLNENIEERFLKIEDNYYKNKRV